MMPRIDDFKNLRCGYAFFWWLEAAQRILINPSLFWTLGSYIR